MTLQTTFSQARANFTSLCNAAADDREVIIIRRRNAGDVALIAADELSSLIETAHLLRSPRNAERLLAALARARTGEVAPGTLEELRTEVGMTQDEEH
jgi:antitoxin YefM